MRSVLGRALIVVALGHFVIDINANLLPVMLPFVRAEQGLTYAQAGFVMACFSTTSSLMQPVLGYLADRFGSRATLALSVLWMGLFVGVAGSARSFPLLVALVTLAGLGSAAFHPQGAANARLVGGARAATAISVFSLTGIAGFALGPMVGAAAFSAYGLPATAFFVPLSVVSAASILAFAPSSSRRGVSPAGSGGSDGFRAIPLFALVSVLLVVVARAVLESTVIAYTPLRLSEDLAYSSRILFVILFGQAVGTFLGGLVADRVGRRALMVATMAALVPQVYLFNTLSGAGLLVVAATTGISMGATIPVTIVAAQELLPRNVGVASGLTMGFAFGLAGVGVAGIGALADQIGLQAALLVVPVAPLIGAVIAATCPVAARQARPGLPATTEATAAQG